MAGGLQETAGTRKWTCPFSGAQCEKETWVPHRNSSLVYLVDDDDCLREGLCRYLNCAVSKCVITLPRNRGGRRAQHIRAGRNLRYCRQGAFCSVGS
jgi:hypothetical protein